MPDRPTARTTLTALRRLAESALDWFYPRHCYHCGRPDEAPHARTLCADCSAELRKLRIAGFVCDVCGLPLAGEPQAGTLCVTCRAELRHFDRARAFVRYAGPARSIIRSFKFDGCYFLGERVLGAMLARGWLPAGADGSDALLPIPLHPRRKRERGYDQALLLGRVLARRLDRPLLTGALVRSRYTSQQSLLPLRQRRDNMRGAFAVRRPAAVQGLSLLLVDDVLTTGTTARECAKVLKEAGAARVQVLTLARTAP